MELKDITKEHVLSEVAKLQYLYKLKSEIRYNHNRHEDDSTESVAEHIFGMHIIAAYFLPLIDDKNQWNHSRMYEIITVHDIDEIETGDTIGYLKSESDRNREGEMMRKVIEGTPKHMQTNLVSLVNEYEDQATIESRFVKAIDKFEPLIHLYNAKGKLILKKNKTTATNSVSIKKPYLKEFPIMFTYYEYIHQAMIEEGFFHPEK